MVQALGILMCKKTASENPVNMQLHLTLSAGKQKSEELCCRPGCQLSAKLLETCSVAASSWSSLSEDREVVSFHPASAAAAFEQPLPCHTFSGSTPTADTKQSWPRPFLPGARSVIDGTLRQASSWGSSDISRAPSWLKHSFCLKPHFSSLDPGGQNLRRTLLKFVARQLLSLRC